MPLLTRRQLVSGTTAAAAPPRADYWLRVQRTAMACRFEVTLGGEDAADVAAARRALDQVDAIEDRLTVFRDTSLVSHINRTAAARPVALDDDLLNLLVHCEMLQRETGGAFDITSTPLSRCWGFLRREGRLPTEGEITSARDVVGMRHISIDTKARTVRFARSGVQINLGAIGKGWALDHIAHTLRKDGVRRALLSAGRSSIRAVGGPADGWDVNLSSPRLDRPIARVRLREGAMGTSGAGEQFFHSDGQRYGHIIDPRTGWPAEGALSVSVITSTAAAADALSTAFFVGGIDLARLYCATHANVLAIFTADDHVTGTVLIGRFDHAHVEVA